MGEDFLLLSIRDYETERALHCSHFLCNCSPGGLCWPGLTVPVTYTTDKLSSVPLFTRRAHSTGFTSPSEIDLIFLGLIFPVRLETTGHADDWSPIHLESSATSSHFTLGICHPHFVTHTSPAPRNPPPPYHPTIPSPHPPNPTTTFPFHPPIPSQRRIQTPSSPPSIPKSAQNRNELPLSPNPRDGVVTRGGMRTRAGMFPLRSVSGRSVSGAADFGGSFWRGPHALDLWCFGRGVGRGGVMRR